MSGFRDIHAHFVYGLDDGAQTRQDMEAMLDAAHADGIASLFATPHVTPGIRPFDDALYTQRLEEARAYCASKGYGITLHRGAEIMYTPALKPYALEHRLPTLGDTRYALMEFSPGIAYDDIINAVSLMERGGYRAVLAHVERYRCLYRGRAAQRLKREHDVWFQMNGATVVRGNGFWRNRVIRRWLREGLIDFIATDTHNRQTRPTNMTAAYDALERLVGRERAERLTGRADNDFFRDDAGGE